MIAVIAALASSLQPPASSAFREQRFVELLRTYPERAPAETFRQVAALIEDGPFPQRDRAEYWMGSARLATGDRDGARSWFDRVGRDYPGSVWEERSWLGLADAAAQERSFGEALRWCARAQAANDAAVREIGGITAANVRTLQRRQRIAWIAGAVAIGIALFLAAGARRGPFLPVPAEARILVPVLAVLAILSTRVDPAPRGAVLTICAAGALLSFIGGVRLRALRLPLSGRLVQASLALIALACTGYVAVYRFDLVGMVAETLRGRPE